MESATSVFRSGTQESFEAHKTVSTHVARIVRRGIPLHVDKRDLIQAGWVGLLDAYAKRTVPVLCKQFWGYAGIRVNGSVYDQLRSMDHLNRSQRVRRRRVLQEQAVFEAMHGREPTLIELSEACELTPKQLQDSLGLPGTLDSIEGDDLWEQHRNKRSKTDPEAELIRKAHLMLLSAEVDQTFALMRGRDRKILIMRLVDEKKTVDIAHELNITKTNAMAILSRAKRIFREVHCRAA